MFLGDLELLFLLEIVFRTVIMYGYAFLLVRFLGKRGLGQLSPFEFVIIIALGSSVGDPMFSAEVPIIYSMVVITIVVFLNRVLARATQRNQRLEAYLESHPACLVRDGKIDVEALSEERISNQEVFSAMRLAGAHQLGQVKRAYPEPSGRFSTFLAPEDEVAPGLALYPECDDSFQAPLLAGSSAPEDGDYACGHCGLPLRLSAGSAVAACSACGETAWEPAITTAGGAAVSNN
jgi:uncharacterized membrane protein YcaP (DUF421 family)